MRVASMLHLGMLNTWHESMGWPGNGRVTIAAFATSIAGAQVPEGDVLVDDPALA
ncbi:MAG: hypothetical protein R3C56_15550 [Pirellulaceae bacterium]